MPPSSYPVATSPVGWWRLRSSWWSSRPPPSSQAVGGDRRFCYARRVTVSPKTQSLLKCPNVPGAGEPLASAGDQRCSEARKCASRGRERKGNSNEESSVCFGRDSRCGKRCWLRRHRQGQGPPACRDQGLTSIIYPIAPGLDIVGGHHAGAPTMSAVVVSGINVLPHAP